MPIIARLQEAATTPALDDDWTLWKNLQQLKVFKSNKQLPADYQELARTVIGHADNLHLHPGPLENARQHTAVLMESAWDALADYGRAQAGKKGIVDFTDMIDMAWRLLDVPEVLEHVAARFDCLVIDEFQDTNPLQFAMLWRLYRHGRAGPCGGRCQTVHHGISIRRSPADVCHDGLLS